MRIASVQNGVITNVGHYKTMFPNVSFPTSGPDTDFLTANGCVLVADTLPYNPSTEQLVNVSPYLDGDICRTVAVQSLSQEELSLREEVHWNMVRSDRNAKLQACDWTQLPDSPLSAQQKADWANYRQLLRDITENFSSVQELVWPTAPQL